MKTIQIYRKYVLVIRKYWDYTRDIEEILIKIFKIIDFETNLMFDIIASCGSNNGYPCFTWVFNE